MAAQEGSINDFGLLIAYVLPGFATLWAATYLTPALDPWLSGTPPDGPTVGGFLYTTVAAIAAGLVVSTVRWLVVDTIHHRTGLTPPPWDFAQLKDSVAAFGVIVDHYYRYYQFAANMLVAIATGFLARRLSVGRLVAPFDPFEWALVALEVVLFIGSRDSLKRYYARGGRLLRADGHGHA